MELSKLKSGLLHTIEEYNGRAVGVGELRVDLMARDCFNAIQELETENAKLHSAPANGPLTLEQLRGMERGWVWLIDVKHSEYDGWYNVRPFHDGSGGIELYGVDNNYYERAITAGSVKVYARKPEGDNDVH